MTLDTVAQLWDFARCSPYSEVSVVNTAHFLIANGVPEDRVLGMIQTLSAPRICSLELMAEYVVQVTSPEASLC